MAEPNDDIHCGVCYVQGRTYTCVHCIRSELREHQAKLKQAMAERDELAAQVNKLLSPEVRRLQMLLSQREMAVKHAATIQDERKRLQSEVDQDRQRLARLQARISQRKETLKLARARLEVSKISEVPAVQDSIQQLRTCWAGVHQKLQHSRCVLVSEVMSLFDLKCVPERRRRPLPPLTASPPLPASNSTGTHQSRQQQQQKRQESHGNVHAASASNGEATSTTTLTSAPPPPPPVQRSGSTRLRVRDYLEEDSWNEYLIVGRPLPTGYFDNYDRDEINTSIGNVVHMSTLIACYLGIKLPFLTYLRSFVYHIHPILSASSRRMPLNLSEMNLESFAMGLAMLNYNIAYLCYSQGVYIPLKKAPNTLENLLACCQSPNLGKYTQYASMMARQQQQQQEQHAQDKERHLPKQAGASRSSPPHHHQQWDQEQPFDLDLFQLAQILRSRQEESSVWGGLQLHDAIAATDNYVDDYFLEDEEDGDEDDEEEEEEDEDEGEDDGEEEGDGGRRGNHAETNSAANGRLLRHSSAPNGIKASNATMSATTGGQRRKAAAGGGGGGGSGHGSRGAGRRSVSSHVPGLVGSSNATATTSTASENWTFLDVDIVRIPSANNYGSGLLGGRGWAAAVPGVVPSALKQIRQIGSAVGSKALGTRQS